MLNHALVSTLETSRRRASLGAALTPTEAGEAQGKADKQAGEPMDLNYGASKYSAAADAVAAQAAYEKAYKAATSPAGWVGWLALVLGSATALLAYGLHQASKGSGGEDREAMLPPAPDYPEPGVYGTSTGTAYGAW